MFAESTKHNSQTVSLSTTFFENRDPTQKTCSSSEIYDYTSPYHRWKGLSRRGCRALHSLTQTDTQTLKTSGSRSRSSCCVCLPQFWRVLSLLCPLFGVRWQTSTGATWELVADWILCLSVPVCIWHCFSHCKHVKYRTQVYSIRGGSYFHFSLSTAE